MNHAHPTDTGGDVAALCDQLAVDLDPVRLDLTGGPWEADRTVTITLPPNSEIVGGYIIGTGGPIVRLDCGPGTSKTGTLRVEGARRSSWLTHRTPGDALVVERWNGCRDDGGIAVGWVQRSGVVVAGSLIRGHLGAVDADWCGGTASHSPDYTRSRAVATRVERTGRAGSHAQRAHVDLDQPLTAAQPGDYMLLGSSVVRIEAIGDDSVEVFPWPDEEGVGAWECNAWPGAAVHLRGGNTAASTIRGIGAMRCGVGLRSDALYGCTVTGLLAEACGVALLTGHGARALTVAGWHPEQTDRDVVQDGSAVGCTLLGGSIPLTGAKTEVVFAHLGTRRTALPLMIRDGAWGVA